MDVVERTVRSKIMSNVGQKDTGPEMKLRRALHSLGYRYRLHDRKLPGSPDLVFPKYKAVIFVHGCYWHRHGCHLSTMPKSNDVFWSKKFEANKARDKRNIEKLKEDGWIVLVVWECALKGKRKISIDLLTERIVEWLSSSSAIAEITNHYDP